jgi:hypothetical protein
MYKWYRQIDTYFEDQYRELHSRFDEDTYWYSGVGDSSYGGSGLGLGSTSSILDGYSNDAYAVELSRQE